MSASNFSVTNGLQLLTHLAMTALSSARQTSNRHRSARTAPGARTAHRMDDCSGRSPDLRLIARFSAFPRPEAQWLSWKRANRLQLRAQLRIWLRTYETSPHSHFVDLSINEPELHNLRGNFAVVKAAGSSFLLGTGTADLGLGSFATGPGQQQVRRCPLSRRKRREIQSRE